MGKDKVVDYLDSSEVLAQLAEECSEAAQAALKNAPGSGRRESHPGDTGGSHEQFD